MLKEMLEFFSIITGAAIILGILITTPMILTNVAICHGFQSTGYETKFDWGCYAKVDGKWVPADYVFGKANELRLKAK